jgi:tetratricopeptide (TPR) repeat protein
MFRNLLIAILLVSFSFARSLAQQAAPTPAEASKAKPAPDSAADLVLRGTKLSHEGRQDDALILFRLAIEKAPDSFEAYLGVGIALDLNGDYAKARENFSKAIDLAPAEAKSQPQRALAVSYAFEGNTFKAAESEMQVFNARLAKSDSVAAAETCTELGRIYLEAGDPDHAYKWYMLGYNTVAKKPDLSDADKNLWLFRWENAQARIAAQRGKADEAQQHVRAAKAALDKANNPEQMKFYPYLTGYVAFYTGDYKTAVADLQKADQLDPAVQALLAEAYEKSGDAAQAKAHYQRVLNSNGHNPAIAFARPLAKKKLAGGA